MLRTPATRSFAKSFTRIPSARYSYTVASNRLRNVTPAAQLSSKRPQVHQSLTRPTISSLLYATDTGFPYQKIDVEAERKLGERKMEAHPELVSAGSSVRHLFDRSEKPPKEQDDGDMLAGIRADLKTIKETFSLADVPKESLYIGAAGVIPYALTSMSTVFLAYDINHSHQYGNGVLFTAETAHQLLDLVTPIQIGYGAVIISFLGAIHWGLEYAGYGGHHSYRRFMYGVIAPAVAWPTMFMPIEYALITQFLTFNFLYFADARATVRGWFPPWYSVYRFVLTFLVGASIVISLIGRGQIVSADHSLKTPLAYIKDDRDAQWEALEREEKERRAQLAAGEAGDDEEGGDDEAEEGGDDKE